MTEEFKTDFRNLIAFIYRNYKDRQFTTDELFQLVSEGSQYNLSHEFKRKLSNSLRRLYIMGFLKRKRVPRLTSAGSKGYMYIYSLNAQGVSYSKYLENESLLSKVNMFDLVRANKLKEFDPLFWDIIVKLFLANKKGFRRFPSMGSRIKSTAMKLELSNCQNTKSDFRSLFLASLDVIIDLEKELERTNSYNRLLSYSLIELKSKLDMYRMALVFLAILYSNSS